MKLHSFPASFCINVEGLEVSKQRLLSAHLPFLPACISERDKLSYLSSCISFDSSLMVSQLSTYNIILSISHGSAGDDHFRVCVCVCTSVG